MRPISCLLRLAPKPGPRAVLSHRHLSIVRPPPGHSRAGLAVGVATLLASCGDLNAPGFVPVAAVQVLPAHASLAVDANLQLRVMLRDADGARLEGRTVTWSTDDPTVATVTVQGLVRRLTNGTARIVATSESVEGFATITEGPPLAFTSLSLGTFHSCGLTATGVAYCWGDNRAGQLGDGTATSRLIPVPVAGGLTFAAISARGATHSCGLTPEGATYCWGSDEHGQLGDQAMTFSPIPVRVTDDAQFGTLSVERSHTCGISDLGQASCWGYNFLGQLGDGSTTDSDRPMPVRGGIAFAAVSPGSDHTCALDREGKAHCWGDNAFGELGDATNTRSLVPVAVAGDLTFASLSARDHHSCALTTDGTAYCWGSNVFGELGDASTNDSNLPVPVRVFSAFASLSAGSYHTCALTQSGLTLCWGRNTEGQLGDGTVEESHVPAAIASSLRFAEIAVGCFHSCGITAAGQAFCWGRNAEGQLGLGSVSPSPVPVAVAPPA